MLSNNICAMRSAGNETPFESLNVVPRASIIVEEAEGVSEAEAMVVVVSGRLVSPRRAPWAARVRVSSLSVRFYLFI